MGAAHAAGLLTGPATTALGVGKTADANRVLLIELKDYRKDARHRANMSFEPWLQQSWEKLALVIERLATAKPL